MFKLRKPLGKGLTRLRDHGPHLSDLAGLLTGVKPVVRIEMTRRDRPYAVDLCERLGLLHIAPGNPARDLLRKGFTTMLISRKSSWLRKADKLCSKAGPTHPEIGRLLGYPDCCVRAYVAWARRKGRAAREDAGRFPHIVRHTRARTRGDGPLPFLLNNVFNYYSMPRLGSARATREDRKDYERIHRRNERLGLSTLHAVSWHPCGYRCRASLRKARTAWCFLESYLPDFAAKLRLCLAKPVLVLGKYEFVVFAGRTTKDGSVEYSSMQPPFSLVDPRLRDRLAKTRLARVRGRAVVDRSGKTLYRAAAGRLAPMLLDFTGGA